MRLEPLNASRKTGVSPWYAVLVESAKAKRISTGRPTPMYDRSGTWEATVDALAYSHGSRMTVSGRGKRAGIHVYVQALGMAKSIWFFMRSTRAIRLPIHEAKDLQVGDRFRWWSRSQSPGSCVGEVAGKAQVKPPICSARSRVSGRGEDGANGRAKPSGSGKLRWFAAVPKPGAARTRRREGCKRAQ